MSIRWDGEHLRALSQRLKDAGDEGNGLRRELLKQISDAAKPLAEKIATEEHLDPYMPEQYAAILARDLNVSTQKLFARNPRISVRARGRQHRRKVEWLNQGYINHPVFARGPRKTWRWENRQTGGMKPGFFDDAVEDMLPEVRAAVVKALDNVADQVVR